jgi:large conductance mechanosensitive channel
MLKDFKEFAIKGNVIDMAVGIIVGAAFTTVVKSLVDDLLMPPLGLILGNVDFSDKFLLLRGGTPEPPYASLDQAKKAGATLLSYGQFINAMVSFVIVAFVLFLVVRWVTKLRRPAPATATTKNCPYCKSSIALAATRCPQCTSQLEGKAAATP